jgi:hypothetical protein
MLHAHSLNLTPFNRPLVATWTSGSDWSHARPFASADGFAGDLVPPSIDNDLLQFEVHYREGGHKESGSSCYFGFNRIAIMDQPLDEILRLVAKHVQFGDSISTLIRSIASTLECSTILLERACLGVQTEWLYNPRVEGSGDILISKNRFVDEFYHAREAFSSKLTFPIVCELLTKSGEMWIAFDVSSKVSNGFYAIDRNKLRRLASETLCLS